MTLAESNDAEEGTSLCERRERALKQLEHEIIISMRTAIANLGIDRAIVRQHMTAAHELFADHIMEFSEAFCQLYNQMLEIHRAYTPMPTGHYRLKHIEVGYSSLPVQIWVADKEQPPKPTADELVARFDQVISVSIGSEGGDHFCNAISH